MNSGISTPADGAAAEPETSFQSYTRELGLTFQAPLPCPRLIDPILDELRAVIAETPTDARDHLCWDGSWSTIALLSVQSGGALSTQAAYARCPLLAGLLSEFGGAVGTCVLARIAPGDLLDWHHDPVAADHAAVRLHLPVETDPAAVTDFCHERVHWPAGGLYYGDYGFPHRVFNTGALERIHLYVDVPAEPVRALLPDPLTAPRHRKRDQAVGLWSQWRGDRLVSPASVPA